MTSWAEAAVYITLIVAAAAVLIVMTLRGDD